MTILIFNHDSVSFVDHKLWYLCLINILSFANRILFGHYTLDRSSHCERMLKNINLKKRTKKK